VIREEAFGQTDRTSFVDNFGVWLSGRKVRRAVGSLRDVDLGDFGCGYHASFVRSVLPEVASVTLGDIDLASDLIEHPKITAIKGDLPGTLERVPSSSLDVVLCLSVLEHLDEPDQALSHFHRMLRPGGVCVVNVPTWVGKFFLEVSAFRLDLWPQLVRAGFPPHAIRCRRHKFGLNTIAVCRNEETIS
jgi:2-polyprenyl-3-methyl-5-hydroxy-6-metoxy-1,4-benzoquinol methylase